MYYPEEGTLKVTSPYISSELSCARALTYPDDPLTIYLGCQTTGAALIVKLIKTNSGGGQITLIEEQRTYLRFKNSDGQFTAISTLRSFTRMNKPPGAEET